MAFHSSLVTEILLNIPVVLLQRLNNIQNIIIPQSPEKVYDISLFIGSVLAPERSDLFNRKWYLHGVNDSTT